MVSLFQVVVMVKNFQKLMILSEPDHNIPWTWLISIHLIVCKNFKKFHIVIFKIKLRKCVTNSLAELLCLSMNRVNTFFPHLKLLISKCSPNKKECLRKCSINSTLKVIFSTIMHKYTFKGCTIYTSYKLMFYGKFKKK